MNVNLTNNKCDAKKSIDNADNTSQFLIAVNRYQQKIVIDPHDHIGEIILRDGIYDRIGIQYIEKILSQLHQPVVFDIGANIGNHALIMARHSHKVYLFEPQHTIVKFLHHTKALNQIHNWHICPFGLGKIDQTLALYRNLDGNNGASTFTSHLKSAHFEIEQASILNGDHFVNEAGINRIDFIKLDVEGFEAEVIAGLKESILRYQPIILMEWNNPVTKQQFQDYHLREGIFNDYCFKSIIHNQHKSRWQSKSLGKYRRFIYKSLMPKRWLIEDFIPDFNYQHVVLIPKSKSSIISHL